jgi:hypothetical protein
MTTGTYSTCSQPSQLNEKKDGNKKPKENRPSTMAHGHQSASLPHKSTFLAEDNALT